jgi:hypothetical protein
LRRDRLAHRVGRAGAQPHPRLTPISAGPAPLPPGGPGGPLYSTPLI